MIKICHMTSAHNSNDVRIFYKECTSLAKAGYDTYLVARGESREENGVHIVGVGEPTSGRLYRMTNFAKRIYEKAAALDAEIYQIHDPELLPFALKLKKNGKCVIFDSHENYTKQISERGYIPKAIRGFVSNVYHQYETYVTKKLNAVVVPCTFKGKNIFENRAPITVLIANYPMRQELYDKYDPKVKGDSYVCYSGTIAEANGNTILIKAAKRANIKLVLAGGFSSSNYEQSLKESPEFSIVDYRGYVSRSEIVEILQHASIGAYINQHVGQNGTLDSFGVKVFEYMAMGLPILVDDSPYAKQVINKYHCGLFVDPGDISAVADAMRCILVDSERTRQMGQNGRLAVAKEFNWGTQEKKLIDLYHAMLDGKTKL